MASAVESVARQVMASTVGVAASEARRISVRTLKDDVSP